MPQSQIEQSKGILNPRTGEQKFRLSRCPPAEDLSFFVQRYWIVRWNLKEGKTHTQKTLPSPCVNLVVEHDRAGIFGLVRQTFERRLEGTGWAFGVKFRTGAFYPFLHSPICELTDSSISLHNVFGADGRSLETAMQASESVDEWIGRMGEFLESQLPDRDENVETVNRIVKRIAGESAITTVDDVLDPLEMSKRTLQRLFRRYVGVGPKWVIQRYRLQEAADRLAKEDTVDWTEMALDLGYYDQSHFIKDFKAIIGVPPAEYARRAGSDS